MPETDLDTRQDEPCQTEKLAESEVAANPERKIHTRAKEVESNGITIPNLPSSSSSKFVEKSVVSSSKTPSQKNNKIQSSSAKTSLQQAKRRKISSIEPSIQKTDIAAISRPGSEDVTVDDSILQSKVYQIYNQYEDTNEAMKAIMNMPNIIEFHEPSHKMIDKDRLKIMVGSIWPEGPPSLNQMKEYIAKSRYLPRFVKYSNDDKKKELFFILNCFTRISFVAPIGFECWYIKDFEKGPGISKWYRGYACKILSAIRIAQLNAMGVRIPRSNKISKTFPWVDFAESSLHQKTGMVCD